MIRGEFRNRVFVVLPEVNRRSKEFKEFMFDVFSHCLRVGSANQVRIHFG